LLTVAPVKHVEPIPWMSGSETVASVKGSFTSTVAGAALADGALLNANVMLKAANDAATSTGRTLRSRERMARRSGDDRFDSPAMTGTRFTRIADDADKSAGSRGH